MTVTVAERRVKKELQKLRKDPLDGMTVEVGDVPTEWFVTIVGESDVLSSCFLVRVVFFCVSLLFLRVSS